MPGDSGIARCDSSDNFRQEKTAESEPARKAARFRICRSREGGHPPPPPSVDSYARNRGGGLRCSCIASPRREPKRVNLPPVPLGWSPPTALHQQDASRVQRGASWRGRRGRKTRRAAINWIPDWQFPVCRTPPRFPQSSPLSPIEHAPQADRPVTQLSPLAAIPSRYRRNIWSSNGELHRKIASLLLINLRERYTHLFSRIKLFLFWIWKDRYWWKENNIFKNMYESTYRGMKYLINSFKWKMNLINLCLFPYKIVKKYEKMYDIVVYCYHYVKSGIRDILSSFLHGRLEFCISLNFAVTTQVIKGDQAEPIAFRSSSAAEFFPTKANRGNHSTTSCSWR